MAFVPYAPFEERRGEERRGECAAAAAPFATYDVSRGQRYPARVMPSTGIPPDGSLVWWDEKHTRFLRLREFVWVVASPPRQRGPHRQAATQECTQIGGNGPSAQFWGIRVHYCDARIARAAVGTKECTQIGGNGPSAQFWGIRVHYCDASRVGWHECLDRHGAPAAPPRWPPLPWSGKQALRERRR